MNMFIIMWMFVYESSTNKMGGGINIYNILGNISTFPWIPESFSRKFTNVSDFSNIQDIFSKD